MTLPRSIRLQWGNRQNAKPRDRILSHRFKQVHGNRIATLTSPEDDLGETDGVFTTLTETLIGVSTADCVPILLFRNDAAAIGAVHAGWRGTIAGIAVEFAAEINRRGDHPRNWTALIGPAARSCCYEVSEELVEKFKSAFPSIPEHELFPKQRHLDLQRVNFEQLSRSGFSKVKIIAECTICTRDPSGEFKFHSYRRGDRDARQISTLMITKDE